MSLAEKFTQFIQSTNKAILRSVQASDEIFGGIDKTYYDENTLEMFSNADKTFELCKALRLAILEALYPNPGDQYAVRLNTKFEEVKSNIPTPLEKLGQTTVELATELPETPLATYLSAWGSTAVELGQSEMQLNSVVRADILNTLYRFIKFDWPEIQEEREKLENLRLDYDVIRRKIERKPEVEKTELDQTTLNQAKSAFQSQLYQVQLVLEHRNVVHNQIIQGLKKMVHYQRTHYEFCIQRMGTLNTYLETIDSYQL